MINAKLHHIAVLISKEQNLDFYKTLGFKETSRTVRKEKNDIVVFMDGLGVTLEVFIDSNHPLHSANNEPFGLKHIAFEVKNVEKAREELSFLNPGPINEKYHFFFVTDPDGQKIEFKEAYV